MLAVTSQVSRPARHLAGLGAHGRGPGTDAAPSQIPTLLSCAGYNPAPHLGRGLVDGIQQEVAVPDSPGGLREGPGLWAR